jgi:hypothetical protein
MIKDVLVFLLFGSVHEYVDSELLAFLVKKNRPQVPLSVPPESKVHVPLLSVGVAEPPPPLFVLEHTIANIVCPSDVPEGIFWVIAVWLEVLRS